MITVPLCMSDALQLCTTPVQYRIFSFCLSSLRTYSCMLPGRGAGLRGGRARVGGPSVADSPSVDAFA